MKAHVGDLVIYQVYFPGIGQNYWENRADIIYDENDLDYYNHAGRFKNNKYYHINYIIPAKDLEKYKKLDFSLMFDKVEE